MPPPVDTYDATTLSRLRDAALKLLPPGSGFTKRVDSMIGRVLEALTVELARIHLEALSVRRHVFVWLATREDYVRAWEEATGSGSAGTLAERVARAAAIVRAPVAPWSLPGWRATAAPLGHTFNGFLAQNPPFFQAGVSGADQPVADDGWAYYFEFTAANETLRGQLIDAFTLHNKRAHTVLRPMPPEAFLVDNEMDQVWTPSGRVVMA